MSSSNHVKGSVPKNRSSSGWKAFDLKQRQNPQSNIEKSKLDPKENYPILSETTHLGRHHYLGKNIERPFSSVVASSTNFPLEDAYNNCHLNNFTGESFFDATAHAGKNSVTVEPFQKLCTLHLWADESLIKDVLAGVGDNVDEAYALLEAMRASKSNDVDSKSEKIESIDLYNASSGGAHGVFLGKMENAGFTAGMGPKYDEASSKLLLDILKSVPMEPEPEWEEDDVYLVHRRDAIKMIRSAARHSKDANDAYMKGDRYNAHQLSIKAQEEWNAAEKLNAKAAKDILSLRNSKNDIWTLDLHGLHATEAVQALADRLQYVESLATLNSAHKESEGSMKQVPLPRQRPTSLEVITGKGNHSRGAASLPYAIRNFLSDNGYHFDETRPGLITVRPKYRRQ